MLRDDQPVKVGQRYRAARPDGTPSLIVWEVFEVYRVGPSEIEHARLRRVGDTFETKTFATAVIMDRARFVPDEIDP